MSRWQTATDCPKTPPTLQDMGERTRTLHEAIDAANQGRQAPWLHPEAPTLMQDLLGSAEVIAWQEAKATAHFLGETCWSEQRPLYARYGVEATRGLLAALKDLEGARAAVVTDCGMQAVALTFDALTEPGSHCVTTRQVYNKSRTYLERLCQRLGGSVSVIDDGDWSALAAVVRPETALVFAETFTNPLVRVQDPVAMAAAVRAARLTAPGLKGVLDDTIATPWGSRHPLLSHEGIDLVVGSGTKALGGQDRDLWGYVVGKNPRLVNGIMDLQALRGGVLDGARAARALAGLTEAERLHARRCDTATQVASFLADHPQVEQVWHPSLPEHPDHAVYAEHYKRPGSLLSFRVKGADEQRTRHLADVLATFGVIRYALSFDGLVTKVNHHQSVSEYFTPPPVLRRNGLDRLVRLGVGLEDAEDLIAMLNWTLWHGAGVSPEAVAQWQTERGRAVAGSLPD